MAEIIKLERKPEWQASFDLFRDQNGTLVVILADARMTLIERPLTPSQNLLNIADMIEQGLEGMRLEAQKIGGE